MARDNDVNPGIRLVPFSHYTNSGRCEGMWVLVVCSGAESRPGPALRVGALRVVVLWTLL